MEKEKGNVDKRNKHQQWPGDGHTQFHRNKKHSNAEYDKDPLENNAQYPLFQQGVGGCGYNRNQQALKEENHVYPVVKRQLFAKIPLRKKVSDSPHNTFLSAVSLITTQTAYWWVLSASLPSVNAKLPNCLEIAAC
ncbi:hypothetical protein LJC60_08440 [Ruminococcaceae bacterium OttesenSCG-928-D13]|nr:hypothetical protein [Ruminococcaceae bacterium OttesenSCG-928-D13]